MDEQCLVPRPRLGDVRREGDSPDERVVTQAPGRDVAQTEWVPWWAVVAAAAAPALLVGGFFAAAGLQPATYSPVRDTISELAAKGATDPWVMMTALAAVGSCYLLAAFGLRPARRAGRGALAAAGVATLLIAAFRQPHHGYSIPHEAAVIAACTTMCAWPVLGARRRHRAPLLSLPASVTATAVTLGLTLWFVFEQHRAELGLAERCAAVAAALWLFSVVLTTRRALARNALSERLSSRLGSPNRPKRAWQVRPASSDAADSGQYSLDAVHPVHVVSATTRD